MRSGYCKLSCLSALALLIGLLIGCSNAGPEPQWTKTRKLAGKDQGLSHISGLVVDDKFAYVTIGGNLADHKEGRSGLRRISLDTGEVTRIETDDSDMPQSERGGFASDGKFLYWNSNGAIRRVLKEGGKPETVVSENVGSGIDLAVDEERVYWIGHGYYSSGAPAVPKAVLSAKKTGGTPEIFAGGQMTPHSLAVDDANVYWLTSDGVVKRPKTGGKSQTLVEIDPAEGIDELALDAESLYFGSRGKGESRWSLKRAAKIGGEATVIAPRFSLKQMTAANGTIHFFDEDGLKNDVLCKVPTNGGEVSRIDTGYSGGHIAQNSGSIIFAGLDDIYIFSK